MELISSIMPDAVSFAEVDEPWGQPSTLSKVAEECGYSWVFGPSFEYGGPHQGGGFGNALLTTARMTAVQHWRVFAPSGGYDGSEPSEPRSVILARLRADGNVFWLGSTHFPREDAEARHSAAASLERLTSRLREPWIICGDFNAPPASCFRDSTGFGVSPDPAQPTYPAGSPAEAIDYCISATGIALSATVLQTPGSDHLPLLINAAFL